MLMLILLINSETVRGTSENSRESGRIMVKGPMVNLRGKVISRKMIKMTTLKFVKGVDVRITVQPNVVFPST
jgi:hypothetical protein